MIEVVFKPSFIKEVRRLEQELQSEVLEKIALFKDRKNHHLLKVHKLHGQLKGRWSFSVNYKIRIVFVYAEKNEVALLIIGDHNIYN
ncbi:MAG: Plasmid stabilization system [Candidatus Magasanikbacteria bacterium GW2011_GWA2_46_17]|uniref:Plasmid stabilization system n=1 Tax=Candidatus Magasanikbacteria bacterium GW2011_GWA2_46_17 TaxID=1619042 RepID=A0A0G1NYJ2_9BACT|nr:MAG: Plasmid stabilization system [Candidatus Magasanikbacteria bacterium GW2011_GWA2_46_17]